MRLKSHLLAGALLALGGFAMAPGEAKAYTGMCPGAGIIYADGKNDVVSFSSPSSLPIQWPTCDAYPTAGGLQIACQKWNDDAVYKSASGQRNKLYNGDVVQVGVRGADMLSMVNPAYPDAGKIFMYHPCTFYGGESRPVVTPPVVLPPNIVDGGRTTVGDGRISSTTSSSTATPSGGSIGVGGTGAGDSVGFR